MSMKSVSDLLSEVEAYEFVQCDIAHEDLTRDTKGMVILDENEMYSWLRECPRAIQNRRPACPHSSTSRNALLDLLSNLNAAGALNGSNINKEEADRVVQDFDRLTPLDREIWDARAKGNPPLSVAKENASMLIQEHHAIVDRMRIFRDKLVVIAHEYLGIPQSTETIS